MPKRPPYTQKSLALIRDHNFTAEVVEKWIMGANIRKDLFGLIDIIAIARGRVLGIQSTGINGRKEHQQTILGHENTVKWLESGAELLQISWDKKLIKKGGSAFRYHPIIDVYELKSGRVTYSTNLEILCTPPIAATLIPKSASASSRA